MLVVKRTFISYVLLVCSLITLIVCLASTSGAAELLTATDPAKTIMLSPQQPQFNLVLPANRTTGFGWFLQDYNSQLLTIVSHHYQAPAVTRPGAGGYEVWTFRAKADAFTAPQITQISLIYARPWQVQEGDKTVQFIVSTVPSSQN